jgi:hypothetical protein
MCSLIDVDTRQSMHAPTGSRHLGRSATWIKGCGRAWVTGKEIHRFARSAILNLSVLSGEYFFLPFDQIATRTPSSTTRSDGIRKNSVAGTALRASTRNSQSRHHGIFGTIAGTSTSRPRK